MHEMALAEGVMVTALALAREHGKSLQLVSVKVGQLQQIEADVMRQCLDSVRPPDEPLLQDMQVQLCTEPVGFRCRICNRDFGLNDLDTPPNADELEAMHFVPELAHASVHCPGCASPDFDIVAGRGVWIERIELL